MEAAVFLFFQKNKKFTQKKIRMRDLFLLFMELEKW